MYEYLAMKSPHLTARLKILSHSLEVYLIALHFLSALTLLSVSVVESLLESQTISIDRSKSLLL